MTAAQLRTFRQAHDLTVAGLAALLMVSPRTIRHWEAGERTIPGPVHAMISLITLVGMGTIDRLARRIVGRYDDVNVNLMGKH